MIGKQYISRLVTTQAEAGDRNWQASPLGRT